MECHKLLPGAVQRFGQLHLTIRGKRFRLLEIEFDGAKMKDRSHGNPWRRANSLDYTRFRRFGAAPAFPGGFWFDGSRLRLGAIVIVAQPGADRRRDFGNRLFLIHTLCLHGDIAPADSAQSQHRNHGFGICLFFSMLNANIRFELLCQINQHLSWPGVQTRLILDHKLNLFHHKLDQFCMGAEPMRQTAKSRRLFFTKIFQDHIWIGGFQQIVERFFIIDHIRQVR